ncbi:MAG: hypothetical protein R3D02_11905 [Hyphomicrobiales bacterium]
MLDLFVLAIAFITVMGNLRSINQTGRPVGNALEAVVGSGNGIDLYRSVAIMKRVPQYHDYLRGSSYLSLVTSFIPRAIWAEKPNPSLGPWVKSELFGEDVRNNGWPPGMVAEAYINFGSVGIVLCMAAWGCESEGVHASFRLTWRLGGRHHRLWRIGLASGLRHPGSELRAGRPANPAVPHSGRALPAPCRCLAEPPPRWPPAGRG